MKSYCAVVTDIIGSRKLSDWHGTLESIRESRTRVNIKFRSELVAEFTPTSGDEFQVALRSPALVYDMLLSLTESLPVEVRCGIGIGDIEGLEGDIVEMRGTAFYRAREAIAAAKKQDRSIFLRSSEETNVMDRILNVLFYFIQTIESGWTERQREVITFYRSRSDFTYEEVGRHFGITKQAVYSILKSADWRAVNEGEEIIRTLLGHWDEVVNRISLTDRSKRVAVYREC